MQLRTTDAALRLAACGFALLLATAAECPAPGTRAAAEVLPGLFAAAVAASDPSTQLEPLLQAARRADPLDPNWPVQSYLLGEAHLLRGETDAARETFRRLALWAAADAPGGPYGDTWGGSGLAPVALWRWLQILEETASSSEEVGRALEAASVLKQTRFYARMGAGGVLPALPLLHEDVARRLAHIAWKAQRPEATSLFLDFLALDSTGELDALDVQIREHMLERKLVTEERLDLFRFKRQLRQVKATAYKEQAGQGLKQLWDDPRSPDDVRAEAGYEWADYKRMTAGKDELVTVLTGVIDLAKDEELAERALYRRATVRNRGSAEQTSPEFVADMTALIRRFPQGQWADDARFQLATEYLFKPGSQLDEALSYFEQLRNIEGRNDYRDSAYFLAALGSFGRGREADLAAAGQLLADYVARHPEGVFRLRCLFWAGRVAERMSVGSAPPQEREALAKRARELFTQVAAEAPYDYYGLRARMHLESGAVATAWALPRADSRLYGEIDAAYRGSQIDDRLLATSPYHARLRAAESSGLYERLLEIDRGLGVEFGGRLDDVPLGRLDQRHRIPAVALLLAVRQDALAAKDTDLSADNELRLTGLLGHRLRDWPIAVEMTLLRGEEHPRRLTELQADPRFLATVYPRAGAVGLEDPLARAAWPIEGSAALSQSLMYAVMRRESSFYPWAISQVGALGLFQIMPDLFNSLDDRLGLRRESGVTSEVEYLLDAEHNISAWVAWVRGEFPPGSRDDVAILLMKHQAGAAAVAAWEVYWRGLAPQGDLEYRIETARFNATRNFVRRVLADATIADGAGLFEERR